MTDVLVCGDIRKSFGPVRALNGTDLRVRRGTIHGLVGENGAGKSTLMKVVMGELTPDSGHLEVGAVPGLIRQQLSTVPEFSVLENIIFGSEPLRHGLVSRRAAAKRIGELMEEIRLPLPLQEEAALLPLALQQRMEILRILYHRAELILMDEPTALLTPSEVDAMSELLRRLVEQGHTVVFITHKLREVEALCDAVTVIRHGATTHQWPDRTFTVTGMAAAMVGESGAGVVASERAGRDLTSADIRLSLDVAGHRIEVRAGEVTGVAGVAGNGQDTLVEHVCGLAEHPGFGQVAIGGVRADGWPTNRRRAAGLRLIPADARQWASAVEADLVDNVATSEVSPAFTGRFGRLRKSAMARHAAEIVEAGQVVTAGIRQKAGELSGGNLQRLVAARELNSDGTVVVAHEPTRGVDFRAARAIRDRLRDFADQGGGTLLISSDLDELFEISDRIVVMYRGEVAGEVHRAEFSRARLGELMGGLDPEAAAAETAGSEAEAAS
ncbi:ATP-binding cassette domain-containing protein [Nonomuraea sp. B10E15]|uniref:ABC transporter ATP-binding protein n=1 Tax=Nonomuraea sp. B10E15 TaxID=3153560 RepID=UPI00325ED921